MIMNKKIIPLIIAILLILYGFKVNAEEKKVIEGTVEQNVVLSAVDCVNKALENNPEIKAAASTTDILKSKIGQAKAGYFPRVELSSGYSRINPLINSSFFKPPDNYYNSYNFSSITLNQLVYDFGKTSGLVKASKLNYESSEKDLQSLINDITYRTKTAYYELLFTQKQLEVMQDIVNKFQQHLNQATAFYNVGVRPKIDVTIAKYNMENAKLNLIKAKNEVEMSFATLNNVMGLPKQAKYTIKDELSYKKPDITFEEVLNTAYEQRPDLMSAKLRAQASEKLVKLAKKAAIPNIEASASYNVGGAKLLDDYGLNAGIKLELPLTNGYKTKKLVDEARAQMNKDNALAQKTENDIYMQSKQAYLAMSEAEQKIPVSESAMQEAKENYEQASARYKAGIGDAIELKDAEIELKNAQMQYYNSILEYNISVANLERIAGTSEI